MARRYHKSSMIATHWKSPCSIRIKDEVTSIKADQMHLESWNQNPTADLERVDGLEHGTLQVRQSPGWSITSTLQPAASLSCDSSPTWAFILEKPNASSNARSLSKAAKTYNPLRYVHSDRTRESPRTLDPARLRLAEQTLSWEGDVGEPTC